MHQHAERTRNLRRDGFTFKQFFVAHDRCAMKVGTDGVLLGAWAALPPAGHILDIGSGSGIVALMLAQRSLPEQTIDAVELDAEASRQAQENVAASPWPDRVRVVNADIADFAADASRRYALIVSNPPYFTPGNACRTPERERARYTESLPHERLLACVRRLLAPDGRFCVVLPSQVAQAFVGLAQHTGWTVRQRVLVSEVAGREPHRVLLTLALSGVHEPDRTLAIRDAEGHYSCDFCALTRNFYLFM